MNPQDWLSKQRQIYSDGEFPNIESTASCHPVSGTWQDNSPHLKSQFAWGGGATQTAFKQLETGIDDRLTQIAVFTFSPVQAFLAGGNRLRDWAVGSWLCHYLTAAIIYRWEQELGGKVLLPLTYNCQLLDWMCARLENYEGDKFWRASLPNVITGLLPPQDNWQETSKQIVTDAWNVLIRSLETATIRQNDYNNLFYGVGWKVIKKDCEHLWSTYSALEPFNADNISQAIARTHLTIEAKKQGRSWEKMWWAGRTSPSAGELSIWHQGLQPIDSENNRGLWGLSDRALTQWFNSVAAPEENDLAGVFSYSDRLNSIEMVKRLASTPEIINETLKLIWHKDAPPCPWDRFPDRTAAAASWIIRAVKAEFWNGELDRWKQALEFKKRNTDWGVKGVDQCQPKFRHPRILERRNICDKPKLTEDDREKLEKWRQTIPADWACTVEWTVGWRGDGDNMGKWLSGEQYRTENLPWRRWHPHSQVPPSGYRQLDLPHVLDLCVLFEKWNEVLYRLVEDVYLGRIIFAGGDDFLILGSLADAISLTTDLHRLWTGEKTADITEPLPLEGWVKLKSNGEIYPVPGRTMTFSLGVVIAQRRIPQSLWHRGLEQAYKQAKQADKDRVCVKVLFNSGQSFNWICPWSLWHLLMKVEPSRKNDSALNRWQKLLSYLETTSIPKGYGTEMGQILEKLWQGIGIPLTWAEIERVALIKPEIENWQWWITWASLRCFLARQERERQQWQQRVTQETDPSREVES